MSIDAVAEPPSDFFQYLELQRSPDMVTKSELLDFVRQYGGRISDRQLTFYTSEGLLPRSVRVGSRAGAYPRVVQELAWWIVTERQRGLSVEALRELLPVWRFLYAGLRSEEVDLRKFEEVARAHVKSREANYAIPAVVRFVMRCPHCVRRIRFRLKDETVATHSNERPVTLGFAIAAMKEGEDGESKAEVVADLRMVLPTLPDPARDPATIVLGIPPGFDPPIRNMNADLDDEGACEAQTEEERG